MEQTWYRFGSGLDGHSIAEELTQLLALLMEPVGSNLWLVDWLWHLYKESLQPFLMLAGPASDGLAVMRFREMWGCLPWHQATFHSSSSGMACALCHVCDVRVQSNRQRNRQPGHMP